MPQEINTSGTQATQLRSLDEVLKEIRDYFDREGWLGVQGFSITMRTRISSHNMKWGDLRLRRWKHDLSPDVAAPSESLREKEESLVNKKE